MKRILLLVLAFVIVFSLASCERTRCPGVPVGSGEAESGDTVGGGTLVPHEGYAHSGTVEGGNYPKGDEPVSWFDAKVISVSGNTILVEAHDESRVKHACAAELYVTTKLYNGEVRTGFEAGDEILIIYDGMIAESYPAQIFTVYEIAFLTVPDGAGGTYVKDEGYSHSGTVEGGNYPKGYEPVSWFDAKIIEVNSDTILVEAHEQAILQGFFDVNTTLYSGEKLTGFDAGDEVRITYNGMVAMSYPAQIFTVYAISKLNSTQSEAPDDFSFAMTWGVFGISSYDSETGKLIKTTDSTHPEDYVTTYFLSDDELNAVWTIIEDLDVENIGKFEYDDFGLSDPHLSLSLTVKTGSIDKTITVPEASLMYEGMTPEAQKFINAIKAIRDILVNTDEWKALPDCENFYE